MSTNGGHREQESKTAETAASSAHPPSDVNVLTPVAKPVERDETAADRPVSEQNDKAAAESLLRLIAPPPDLRPPGTMAVLRKPLTSKKIPINDTDPRWYCAVFKVQKNYGGEATFSVYRPRVENKAPEHSLLQLACVRELPGGLLQTVEAGWRRNPFNDVPESEFFIMYTTNGNTAVGDNLGGFNEKYNGWVQVKDAPYRPGDVLPYSHIGGVQKEIRLKWQLVGDAWYLRVNGDWIGYYPTSLFSDGHPHPTETLADHANYITFFGEVSDSPKFDPSLTTTDMGSGLFPSAGPKKSAYIRNITWQPNPSGKNMKMPEFDGTTNETLPNFDPLRYNMKTHFHSGTKWASYFWLGGPGRKGFDWLQWDTIGGNSHVPGGNFLQGCPITAVSRKRDIIDLFLCAADGKIYTSKWNGDAGWSGFDDSWKPISSPDKFPPGAKVAAVARKPEIIDVFIIGKDEKVYRNSWTQKGGWASTGDWKPISKPLFPSGSEITAVARPPENLDLFACSKSGQVLTAFWNPSVKWPGPNDDWANISQFNALAPGTKVAAVSRTRESLDVFICGPDGQVYWAFWPSPNGIWSSFGPPPKSWVSLGGGPGGPDNITFPPNSPVTAVSRHPTIIDLFVLASNNQVYTSWWTQSDGWLTPTSPWESIGGKPVFQPGYNVAVVSRKADQLDVFVCGTDGKVYTSWWTFGKKWSGQGDPVNGWRNLDGGGFQNGTPAARIEAVARTQGNIGVFVCDTKGKVNQTQWGA